MEDILPADAAEVPGQQVDPVKNISLLSEIRAYDVRERIRKRKLFLKSKKRTRRAVDGGFDGRYRFKKAWLFRKAQLDPKLVAKRLDNDAELKRLRAIMTAPRGRLRTKMANDMYDAASPRILARMNALQHQIDPLVDSLIALDRQMRHWIEELNFLKFKCKHAIPPRRNEIQSKIRLRIKRITVGMARQKVESDRKKLRKAQGFWGYIKKRYEPKKIGRLSGGPLGRPFGSKTKNRKATATKSQETTAGNAPINPTERTS